MFLFGGKAAPGYAHGQAHIKLILHDVAAMIRTTTRRSDRDRLNVAFLPNYNVSLSRDHHPVRDLSEQISMAGKEASAPGT